MHHKLVVHIGVMLLMLPAASAEINDSIFDVLDIEIFNGTVDSGGEYFDGCNQTWTKFDDYTGVGDLHCPSVSPNHISASINITGYQGVVQIDGVDCVSGCPADLAIVDQCVSTSYAGFEANKDWVRQVTTVKSIGGNTTATLQVSFLWHWTTHSSVTGANKKHYRIEHKTVSVTNPHPIVLPNTQIDCIAYITFYNDSRSPVAFIDVDVPEAVIKTTYTYNNTSIIKHNSVGLVHESCVEFTNDSTIWQADPNQTIVSRRGESAVVMDRNFSLSDLSITLHTPYTHYEVTNFSLTVIDHKKPRVGILIKLLSVLGCSVVAVIMMIGVVRRRF